MAWTSPARKKQDRESVQSIAVIFYGHAKYLRSGRGGAATKRGFFFFLFSKFGFQENDNDTGRLLRLSTWWESREMKQACVKETSKGEGTGEQSARFLGSHPPV